jgi:hypothetical protein
MCTSLALKIEAAVIGSSNRRVKILEGRRNDMQPVHIRETAMVTRRAARAEHLVVATASVVLDVLRDSAVVKSGLKKKKKREVMSLGGSAGQSNCAFPHWKWQTISTDRLVWLWLDSRSADEDGEHATTNQPDRYVTTQATRCG